MGTREGVEKIPKGKDGKIATQQQLQNTKQNNDTDEDEGFGQSM